MKKIRHMNNAEFTRLRNKSQRERLSPFAKFHSDLNGYDLYFRETKVCKWEVFASGYINAESIIEGRTKFRAELRK